MGWRKERNRKREGTKTTRRGERAITNFDEKVLWCRVQIMRTHHDSPRRVRSGRATVRLAPVSTRYAMAEDTATGRRPRRAAAKAAAANATQPSAMHYVGYVEEDETPEQIMRKFEQLEKIQREAEEAKAAAAEAKRQLAEENGEAPSDDAGADADGDEATAEADFDEELLLKVFRQTSQFSLKRALRDEAYAEDYEIFGDDAQFSDDEVDPENIFGAYGKKKRKRFGEPRAKKGASRGAQAAESRWSPRQQRQPDALRKERSTRAPNILKLPPHPIPVSWGKVIEPYRSPEELEAEKDALPDCVQREMPIVASAEALPSSLGTDFLAVHCNPPWAIDASPDKGDVTTADVAKIPFDELAPYGFVFIWVEKENLSAVCDVMSEKKFVYVENMTWVQMRPNNTIAGSEASYIKRSHRTMLMFRRDVKQFPAAKDVELRHQRSADCTLDVVCTTAAGRREIPAHVYKAMETLLPEAYKAGYKGRLLELWSEPGSAGRRAGWTVVADKKK